MRPLIVQKACSVSQFGVMVLDVKTLAEGGQQSQHGPTPPADWSANVAELNDEQSGTPPQEDTMDHFNEHGFVPDFTLHKRDDAAQEKDK